jgi:hypothetical protein
MGWCFVIRTPWDSAMHRTVSQLTAISNTQHNGHHYLGRVPSPSTFPSSILSPQTSFISTIVAIPQFLQSRICSTDSVDPSSDVGRVEGTAPSVAAEGN